MSVINTNITSMIAQKNLTASRNSLTTSMERLSSGLRINSAKDDAAGQAIANRMTAQIKGLAQAQRNANDGISVAQTAEGALNQVNDNLQRIRELTVQAANDTNSPEDRDSIQAEINQRLSEINRISEQTNFNGVKVLAGDQSIKIQVGANDGESINVGLQKITSDTLGLAKLDVSSVISSSSLSSNVTTISSAKAAVITNFSYATSNASPFTLAVGDDNKLYASNDGGTTYYEADYDAGSNTVTVSTTAATPTINTGATEFEDTTDGVVTLVEAGAATLVPPAAPSVTGVFMANGGGSTTYYVTDGTDFYDATVDTQTGVVTIDLSTKTNTDPATGVAITAEKVVTNTGTAAVTADLAGITLGGTNTLHKIGDTSEYLVKNVSTDGTESFYRATVNASTGKVGLGEQVVVDQLSAIDNALSTIDSLRSDLGATQNRFMDAITNLGTNETNLSAARSRIQDADYAVEVANMTRAQILQQAGTSVLAQANQIPQSVLSLLG